MTVYVDRAFIPWRKGLWCHLTADTPVELHTFALQLGLRRTWFQTCKRLCVPSRCVHWHYDVNESKRALAVASGAVEIDREQLVALLRARRAYQDSGKVTP